MPIVRKMNLINVLFWTYLETHDDFFSNRIHQCLTMEVIVSSAFGFQVDSQNNPDDPVLKAAKMTMTDTSFERIYLGILLLMPFGMKLLEKIPRLFLSKFVPLLNISEEIVRTKRGSAGSSTRKVTIILFK